MSNLTSYVCCCCFSAANRQYKFARKRVVDVSGVVCSPGLGGSSHQVLLWAAWAGGGLLQPQHGFDHTSTIPGAERGGGGGGDRFNSTIISSPKLPLSPVTGLKTNKQTHKLSPFWPHRHESTAATAATKELCLQRHQRRWIQDGRAAIQVSARYDADQAAAAGQVHVRPPML